MASIRLNTGDNANRLRVYHPEKAPAELRAQMWANSAPDADGSDEWFEVVPSGGDTFGLRCHGKHVSFQPNGDVEVNRDELRSWERMRWSVSEDGTKRLVSVAFGYVLEAKAGERVRAHASPYQKLVVSESSSGQHPPPPPVGGPLSRLRVEDNRRYFANDAGRFDYREVSAFSLLSRLLTGETQYVADWLHRRKAEGFTVTRVILTLDGSYWIHSPHGRSFRCAPDMPGYWAALDTLAVLHADAGLYLRACFLGALEPFGGVWWPDRRDVYEGEVRRKAEAFVVDAAQRLHAYEHVIGELANEPTQIGMRHAWDNGALVSLGRKVKAVAPSMLLCGGEDNDGNGLVDVFDFADAHMDRSDGVEGWQWVKRSGEHFAADQEGKDPDNPQHDPRLFPPRHLYAMRAIPKMAFVAGEQKNFGEAREDGNRGDGPESQPAVAFGAAAVGRARKWAGQCFHFDGGLWTTEPKPETQACIKAWHDGMDAFPMLTDNLWRGHWGLSRGDYFRDDLWPDTDVPSEVEDWLNRGDHAWRAFGVGPYGVVFPMSKGLDVPRHLEAPAERVAFNDQGHFDVAVYRRV